MAKGGMERTIEMKWEQKDKGREVEVRREQRRSVGYTRPGRTAILLPQKVAECVMSPYHPILAPLLIAPGTIRPFHPPPLYATKREGGGIEFRGSLRHWI